MEFAKLRRAAAWSGYVCAKASSLKMEIVGILLAQDVDCNIYPYKETLADDRFTGYGGNFTLVNKDGDHVLIIDLYSKGVVPTEFRMPKKIFIQLLDDWQDKVCKHMPKEVTITYDGNQFTIETSDA
jgi:hypothetical protein